MKTIGDLERWLKINDSVDLTYGPLRKVFYVETAGIKVESKTLEGALENALEELRRKENGAESMRSEKTTNVPGVLTLNSMQAAIKSVVGSGHAILPPPIVHSSNPSAKQFTCAIHGYFPYYPGAVCPTCLASVPKP